MVFEFLLLPDSQARWEFFSHHRHLPERSSSPTALSLVCRRWRDIIDNYPALWSHIHITESLWIPEEAQKEFRSTGAFPKDSLYPNSALHTALSKSQSHQGLAIDIHVHADVWRSHFALQKNLLLQVLNHRVWDTLKPHWDRVGDLSVNFDPRFLISGAPWVGWSYIMSDARNLRRFYLPSFGGQSVPSDFPLAKLALYPPPKEDDPVMKAMKWRHRLQRGFLTSRGLSHRSKGVRIGSLHVQTITPCDIPQKLDQVLGEVENYDEWNVELLAVRHVQNTHFANNQVSQSIPVHQDR
ncbi:hypothetical protein FRC03_007033 [Tulasnella sp. 419]|nr:hypothetical protein FRC03_007033 [Tulasnella sp. 419]